MAALWTGRNFADHRWLFIGCLIFVENRSVVPLLSSFLKPVTFVSHFASSLRNGNASISPLGWNGYWKRLHRMRLDVQQYSCSRTHPRRRMIFNDTLSWSLPIRSFAIRLLRAPGVIEFNSRRSPVATSLCHVKNSALLRQAPFCCSHITISHQLQ